MTLDQPWCCWSNIPLPFYEGLQTLLLAQVLDVWSDHATTPSLIRLIETWLWGLRLCFYLALITYLCLFILMSSYILAQPLGVGAVVRLPRVILINISGPRSSERTRCFHLLVVLLILRALILYQEPFAFLIDIAHAFQLYLRLPYCTYLNNFLTFLSILCSNWFFLASSYEEFELIGLIELFCRSSHFLRRNWLHLRNQFLHQDRQD